MCADVAAFVARRPVSAAKCVTSRGVRAYCAVGDHITELDWAGTFVLLTCIAAGIGGFWICLASVNANIPHSSSVAASPMVPRLYYVCYIFCCVSCCVRYVSVSASDMPRVFGVRLVCDYRGNPSVKLEPMV